jgi:hypothetical protein
MAPAQAPRKAEEEQRFRLRDLLRYDLKTFWANFLKGAFQQLGEYRSPARSARIGN